MVLPISFFQTFCHNYTQRWLRDVWRFALLLAIRSEFVRAINQDVPKLWHFEGESCQTGAWQNYWDTIQKSTTKDVLEASLVLSATCCSSLSVFSTQWQCWGSLNKPEAVMNTVLQGVLWNTKKPRTLETKALLCCVCKFSNSLLLSCSDGI